MATHRYFCATAGLLLNFKTQTKIVMAISPLENVPVQQVRMGWSSKNVEIRRPCPLGYNPLAASSHERTATCQSIRYFAQLQRDEHEENTINHQAEPNTEITEVWPATGPKERREKLVNCQFPSFQDRVSGWHVL